MGNGSRSRSPDRRQINDIFDLARLVIDGAVKQESPDEDRHVPAPDEIEVTKEDQEDDAAAALQAEERQLSVRARTEEEKLRIAIKKKRQRLEQNLRQRKENEQTYEASKAKYDEYLEGLRSLDTSDIGHFTDSGKARRDKYGLFPERKTKRYLVKLSADWEHKIKAALAVASESYVFGKSVDGTELSRRDLARVLPGEPWLNDEIVNAWYANLCARLNAKDGYVKAPNKIPRWVAYSTAWYKTATERGVSSIQGWSKRKGIKGEKLLQTERIFFPTNSGAHWTLLAISGKHKTVEYLDSMNEMGWAAKRYIRLAQDWLRMELGPGFDESEWRILRTKSAQQNNMNDCGVFACLNGWALVKGSKDPSAEFSVSEMPLARKMLVATLMNGGFTGDFDL